VSDKLRSIDSLFCEFDYKLNEQQQDLIKLNQASMSVLDMAKMAYGKQNLDERSEETKNVKKFLIRLGRKHEALELDREQRRYIRDNADKDKPIEIARHIFQKNDLAALSKEVKTVDKYIKVLGVGREFVGEKTDDYKVPPTILKLLPKVNAACSLELSEEKLDGKTKKYLEYLKNYLSTPRFKSTINAMLKAEDKELFECEYIRGTFEKELNTEEINMYISLCSDYVLLKQIKRQLDMLNDEIESAMEEDGATIKMALTEAFGKKSLEFDNCSKRIQKLQESLSGQRSKRVEDQVRLNASLVSFIELWKNEDERRIMFLIAKARQVKVKEQIEKIESESDYVAKVLGISQEEILNG
jgi:hypothetical protein